MGTDIHTVVQVRKGDQWVTVKKSVADDRNYQIFSILADIRNGYGFAGCPTGDAVTPISEPRGLPDDFGRDNDGRHEDHYMGDHSFSWLLLSEMNDYANHNALLSVGKTGVLTLEHYLAIRELGPNAQPLEWCGSVVGRDIVTLSVDEIEKGFAKNTPMLPGKVYVQYDWTVNLIKSCGFDEVVREIYEAAGKEDPRNVRFVFGFDS
jgi:hypothetical protein